MLLNLPYSVTIGSSKGENHSSLSSSASTSNTNTSTSKIEKALKSRPNINVMNNESKRKLHDTNKRDIKKTKRTVSIEEFEFLQEENEKLKLQIKKMKDNEDELIKVRNQLDELKKKHIISWWLENMKRIEGEKNDIDKI